MKRFAALLLTLCLLCTSVFPLSSSAIVFDGKLGDVNNDGKIDASDALQALQHSVSLTTLKRDAFERGEVNADDVINASDALLILQHSVSLITAFPRDLEEENDLETSHAYEPDPTADNSFAVSYDNLAAKTVYLILSSALRNTNRNIETDNYRFFASLQGIINRDFNLEDKTAMVFALPNTTERSWLGYMQGDGKFLNGYETLEIKSFDEFLTAFEAQIRSCGIVLWDTQVPSTANVAATICGVDGTLPVKYDTQEGSLYNRLIEYFGEDIVKLSLVEAFRTPELGAEKTFEGFAYVSSGSSKCDAYLWAIEAYMGRCSSKYMAYTLDGAGSVDGNDTCVHFSPDHNGNCVDNHDYFIARRCFFFDLTPDGTVSACDDPGQLVGADQDTMKKILQARYNRANGEFGQIIGFPPWTVKYTTTSNPPLGDHDATWVEWEFVEWCTAYNLAVEADAPSPANMHNASAYYKYVPTMKQYENNEPAEKLVYDDNTYYYTFYIGDYDSAIWMKYYIEKFWMEDNARGKFPMGWAFNPNLADRLPMLFDYVYENKSENDYFITGDSGPGYIVPEMLLETSSKRTNPDGIRKYLKYAAPYYEKFDMDITGWILNTYYDVQDPLKSMYNQLSPVGVFQGTHMTPTERDLIVYNGVPYLYLRSAPEGEDRLEEMLWYMMGQYVSGCNFTAFRAVVQSPDYYYEFITEYEKYCAGKDITVKYVDPYTLFDLIRQSGQGKSINDSVLSPATGDAFP